jgi:hypothetical protein
MSIHRAMRCAVLGLFLAAGAAVPPPAAGEEEKKEAAAEGKKPAGLLEILKVGKEAEKKEAPKEEAKDGAKPEAGKAPAAAPKEEAGEKGAAAKDGGGEPKKDAAKAKAAVLRVIQGAKVAVDAEAARAAVEAAAAAGEKPAGQAATAEAATEKKDAPPPPRKKEPQPPMFRLRDGTRLAGTPDIKVLHIATPYGRLDVPVSELVQIRFAALNDPQLAGRIAEGIAALGSEEFDKREEAMAALRKIGGPALEALKKALASDDEEVKSRAEKLAGEIEEEQSEAEEESKLGPIAGDEDEVVTLKFTAMGHVEEEVFQLATKYGSLKLKRSDIVSVTFQEAPTTRTTVQVPGNTLAGGNKWHDAKLNVAKGESLVISATGTIHLANYGQSTGPEGTTTVGSQFESHPAGALVGKIGDKGKAFLIGPEYRGTANETGPLRLGVALQNGEVTGNYQVEIEVEGGS